MEAVSKTGIAYDGILIISTAPSRKSTNWKPKKLAWSAFLKYLSVTHRTTETQNEYFAMGKAEQDQIKDVGGFVGGRLNGPNRTAANMGERQLVTLDADFASPDFWETVKLLTSFASCIYSTHKHKKDKPRFRWVIPLSRPVSPDEYQAVSRGIAAKVGIDNFDDTTYQSHRMMYFQSTSADAEYVFEYQDGPWLDPDTILAEYEDWKDQSQWPTSSRQDKIIQREMKKQQDPLEKTGIVGQFCRTYSIHDVMERYLTEEYTPCTVNDRYTYAAGSTSGGAVVYEDKFLYSHHATDPCSCQLVNAFDLVRIQKYGDMDEGKENVVTTALPSYKAMCQLAVNDPEVKKLVVKEAQEAAVDLFADLGDDPIEEEKEDLSWAAKLKCNGKTGKVMSTRENLRLILLNDKRFRGKIAFDLFARRIVRVGKVPWRSDDDDDSNYWDDADDAQTRYLLETLYDIDSRPKIEDEIMSVAHMHAFHCVRDFLNGLSWDGVKRMETLFVDFLGAEDSRYTRAVTRKMLIAAVGRIFRPGLKFDNMVVLEGRQGLGKSYLLKNLGGKWFSDSLTTVQGKEAYEQLRGAWIIEMSELAALKKSEIEPVKQFISKQSDSYREAYGRRITEFPRQNIFVGTTNEVTFLRDRTGNRRFWPVSCGLSEPKLSMWDGHMEDYIKQVWAEAKAAYDSGESVWLGKELEAEARLIQEEHTEENELVGMIGAFLAKPVPSNWYTLDISLRRDYMQGRGFTVEDDDCIQRDKVCLAEIWVELMGGDLARFDFHSKKLIADALDQQEGWEKDKMARFGSSYGRQRCWRNINSVTDLLTL